ncbi:MAG: AmmeMemoRadiSam system protein A [Spirochaetales bacterium]
MTLALSENERRELCEIARESIAAKLFHREPSPRSHGEGCLQPGGVFVTLHENGQLRGCIGRMHSGRPLCETVRDMALAAAFEDPRFMPMSKAEYSEIAIEITVLGPMIRIQGKDDFSIGTHGLYIAAKGRSGVLLPQVATEYGWDKEEFLSHLCVKAGLPLAAWREPGAELFAFEGLVFSEEVS